MDIGKYEEHTPPPEKVCCICGLSIARGGSDEKFSENPENHRGVLGDVHQKCYDKVCEEEPDTPWRDPISGEVDFEAMEEDLGLATGQEEWEEDYV